MTDDLVRLCKQSNTLASNSVNILKLRVSAKEPRDIRGSEGPLSKSNKCIRKNCAYNIMPYDSEIHILQTTDSSVNTAWDRNIISSHPETKTQAYTYKHIHTPLPNPCLGISVSISLAKSFIYLMIYPKYIKVSNTVTYIKRSLLLAFLTVLGVFIEHPLLKCLLRSHK